jgi:hypothetical protein
MKGIVGVCGRALMWIYIAGCTLGFITGVGGGDSRIFFFGMLVIGVALTVLLRYFWRKSMEGGSFFVDAAFQLFFVGWISLTLLAGTQSYKSVLSELPKGYLGALVQDGEIVKILAEPGTYLKSPFASFRMQQAIMGYEITIDAETLDAKSVPLFVRARAEIPQENLADLLKNHPQGIALAPLVEQAVRDAVNRSSNRYEEQEIDASRRELEGRVREATTKELKGHLVNLRDLKLAVFSPDDAL